MKFYVTDLPDIGSHPADDIIFSWDATSFSLTIMDYQGKNKKLAFKRLFASIENAVCKIKANKIIIILTKLEENDWPCPNQGTEQSSN